MQSFVSAQITSSLVDQLYNTIHQDWAPLLNLGYNTKISDSDRKRASPQKMKRATKYRLLLPTVI